MKVPGIENLKCPRNVDYSSTKSAYGFLDAMSEIIDENITAKMKQSPTITVLCDESTDIVVHHKLAINIRVVNPTTLMPTTHFLTDVYLDHGTGKGIYDAVEHELTKRGIPVTKVFGLGTDGATVMTGRKTGVTGQFLKVNPHLQNTHCGAHCVALVSEQAATSNKSIQDFKETVTSIYYYFKHSAQRVHEIKALQEVLEEPTLKYREVHQVRWLSFYSALEAIVRTMDSLISYFHTKGQSGDAKAKGLAKTVGQELFIKSHMACWTGWHPS